jgi:3-methyladenine DNA glycosylase/8-oxoguanine DNA glycosylase
MELVFPTADALSNADLSGLPMPRARSRSLESLAAAIVQDPALLDVRGDLESVVSDLKRLPGIGEWTAQYIAIRQLRETDAFPAADVGLLRALLKPDGSRPSPGELLERSESWRPWRAYAAQHLWNSTPLPAIKTKGQTHAA